MTYEQEQKKTFHLEDGTKVAGSEKICRAYESNRNRERYSYRQQKKHFSFSLDDDCAKELTAKDDTEKDFEHKDQLRILRQAIAALTVREQGIINDYFFNDYSFRTLGKKYGVSHTKIRSEMQTALAKLRQYIIDKDKQSILCTVPILCKHFIKTAFFQLQTTQNFTYILEGYFFTLTKRIEYVT